MAIVFLFPGQGVKRTEGALRAAARSERGAALCESAGRACGVTVAEALRRPSLLDRTEVLQPMLTAIALAASEALAAAGVVPDVVLGHSLGELAAWSAAGGIAADEAVRLAAVRGRLMAREAAAHPGGMVALASAEQGVIDEALAVGRRAGALVVAAHNAPDETVLSGDEAAVRAVLAFAPAIATRVPTVGAWHSPAMQGAINEWRRAIESAERHPPSATFVANRHGDVAPADTIPSLLAEQLVHPVQWRRALATATRPTMVTLGPGAVLRSLWHRNQPKVRRDERALAGARSAPLATDDERALAETISALKASA